MTGESNASPLLQIRNLSVRYGGNVAVRSMDMVVQHGETVALIGANGAGKSSILKALIGVVAAASGELVLNGVDLAGCTTRDRIRHGIAFSPEGRAVFPQLTVRENLDLGYIGIEAATGRTRRGQIFRYFPRLEQRATQQAGTLSGGEQQMLAIGRALMAGPKLLLLDEPTLGLAPIIVKEIVALVTALRQTGLSVIVAEQNASMALSVSQRAYVLANGNTVLSGSSSDLMRDTEVRRAYLGL